jgi:hypothetical protein
MLTFVFFQRNHAQQLGVHHIFSTADKKIFGIGSGYGLSINQNFAAKHRIGFSFAKILSQNPYDEIHASTADGVSLIIKEITPNNSRTYLKLNYSYSLINTEKSGLNIGPEVSLNFFTIDEDFKQIPNGMFPGGVSNYSYSMSNRLGFGLFMEYELKEIISKRLSTFISLNSELTLFEKSGLDGGTKPSLIQWTNYNLGVRYSLKQSKK